MNTPVRYALDISNREIESPLRMAVRPPFLLARPKDARASLFDVRSGQDANAKALGDGLAQKAFADGLASLFQVAHCAPLYVPGSQPTS